MKQEFTQQSEFDTKPEAISSLIFGIISLVLNLSILFYYLQTEIWTLPQYAANTIEFVAGLAFMWGWLIPVLGFALGIMGLRATKSKLALIALAGIILSVIGLVIFVRIVYVLEFTNYVVILPFT